MKLRLPHRLHAALVAALASVSFTTLCSGALTAAFFLGSQAFAEDSPEESMPDEPDQIDEFDIGYANLDDSPEESDEQQKILVDQASIKTIEVGSNGGPGNNAGLLATESVDIDETALDTVAGSGQQDTVSGTVDATPADDLGFTSNPYATGTETSSSDSVFQVTATPAAAVPAVQQVQDVESTTPTTSSSSTNKISTLSVTSGLGSLGGGHSGSSLGVSSPVKVSTPLLGAANGSVVSTDMTGWVGYNAASRTAFVGSMGATNNAGTVYTGTTDYNIQPQWKNTWSYVVTVDAASLISSSNQTVFAIIMSNKDDTGYSEGVKVAASGSNATVTLTSWSNGGQSQSVNVANYNDLTLVLSRDSDAALKFAVYGDGDFAQALFTKEVAGQTFSTTSMAAVTTGGLDSQYHKHGNGANNASLPADSTVGSFVVTGAAYTWGSKITAEQLGTYYTGISHTALTWNGTGSATTWNKSAENWRNGDATATYDESAIAVFAAGDAGKTVTLGESLSAYELKFQESYTLNLGSSNLSTTAGWDITSGKTLTLNGTGTASAWTITGGGKLDNNARLQLGGLGNSTIGSVISGSGSIEKVGTGTLTLNGNNTFIGDVTVDAGTLRLGSQNALGDSNETRRVITVNKGGTIDLNGTKDAKYTYTLNGGTLTNTGALIPDSYAQTTGLILKDNSTINAESNHDFRLLAGNYASTTANLNNHTLTKTGDGTVEFRNTKVFAGTLDIQGGTILFNDSNEESGTLSADVKLNGGTMSGRMNMDGDISVLAEQAATTNAAINTGRHTVTFAGSADLIMNGLIAGDGNLVKMDAGTLTLNGANTYSGGTSINAGTLVAAAQNALGSGAVTVTGGTLDLGGFAHTNMTSLTVSNGGTVTTTHSDSNGSVKGTININSGGTFRLDGQHDAFGWGETKTAKIVLEGASGDGNMATLALKESGASTTMATALEMKGHSQITGAAGFNTFGGNIAVSGTENTIDAMLVRSAVEVNTDTGAELTVNSLTQYGEGNGTLTKMGDGTLILTGEAVSNASTMVSSGTLALTRSVDSVSGSLTIEDGGTLKLAEFDSDAITAGSLMLTKGSILDLSALELVEGRQSYTLVTGGTIGFADAKGFTLGDGISKDGYELSLSGSDLVLTYAQPFNGLVWNGPDGKWSTDGDDKNWHHSAAPEAPVPFTPDSDVKFDSASNGHSVTLTESISAQSMTIDKGTAVTFLPNGNSLNTTLKGEGTYVLPGGTASLPSGLQISQSDWSGLVRVNGGFTSLDIRTLDNIASTIEFAGVTGYFASHGTGEHTLNQNVVFSDVNGSAAVRLTNGFSANGAYKFAGAVGGHGTFELDNSGVSYHIIFAGDVANWDGMFKATNSAAHKDQGGTWIKFSNAAKEVNAQVNKTNGNLKVIADTGVTFNKSITADRLEVTDSNSATLKGQTVVGAIEGPGTVIVENGGTLTLTSANPSFTGDLRVAAGGTLGFSGIDQLNAKNITVESGAAFDLARISPAEAGVITLATATDTLTGPGDWGGIGLKHAGGISDYRYTLGSSQDGKSIVLTLVASDFLIWDGGSNSWDKGEIPHWHDISDGTLSTKTYQDGDWVRFDSESSGSGTTATLGDDVHPGRVKIDSGVTVNLDTNNHSFVADGVSGAGTLVKQGTGNAKLGGYVSLAGLTVQNGTVTVNADVDSASSVGTLSIDTNGTAVVKNATATLSPGGKSIKGSLTVGEGAIVSVGGNDSWNYDAGSNITVTVDGGTLAFGNKRWTVHSRNKLVLHNATVTGAGDGQNGALDFDGGGNSLTSSGTSVVSANIRFRNNTTELAVTDGTLTLSGTLNGGGGINKTGTGTMNITGSNTYSGSTTVSAGTLNANAPNALGTGSITVNSGAALNLNAGMTNIGSVTLNSGSTTRLAGEDMLTLASNQSMTLKSGSTLDLTSLGILTKGCDYTLATGSFNLEDGVEYTLRNIGQKDDTCLVVYGDKLLLVFSDDLTWNGGSGVWSYSEGVTPWHPDNLPETHVSFAVGDSVTFDGTGEPAVATLKENVSANKVVVNAGESRTTFTGHDVTLHANLLTIMTDLTSDVAVEGNATVARDAVWTLTGTTSEDNYTLNAIVGGEGGLVKTGANTVTLSGTNTYSGGTTVSDGTLVATNAQALGAGAVSMAEGTELDLQFSQAADFSNSVSGENAEIKVTGAGQVTITNGANVNVGKTTLESGNLQIKGGTTLYRGDVYINHGRQLTLTPGETGKKYDSAAAAQVNGEVHFTGSSNATVYMTDGCVNFAGGVYVDQPGGTATLQGVHDKNHFIQGLHGQDAVVTLARANSSGGKAGYFNLENQQSGDYSGTLNLSNAATADMSGLLVYNAPQGLAHACVNFNGANRAVLAFMENRNSGTFDNITGKLTGGTFQDGAVAGLDGSNGIVYADKLTVNSSADTIHTYGGVLNIGSLVKVGAGTQALSGDNSSGSFGVSVNEGTLLVSSVRGLGTGAVDVASGATLQFDPALTAPATTGSLTFAQGATLAFGGMDSNALSVTGDLTLDSGSVLDISRLTLGEDTGHVKLASASFLDIVGGVESLTLSGYNGYDLTLKQSGNELWLDYANKTKTLVWGNHKNDGIWLAEEQEVSQENPGQEPNWHRPNDVYVPLGFRNYDRVTFSNTATTSLASDVATGRLEIGSGKTLTVNAQNAGNVYDFNVDDNIEGVKANLVIRGGASETKTSSTTVEGSVALDNLTLDKVHAVIKGHTEVTNTLAVQNDATLTLNSTSSIATLTVNDGMVTLGDKSSINQLNVNNGGNATVSADSTVDGIVLNGGTLTNNASVKMDKGAATGKGKISIASSGTVTGNGYILTNAINLGEDASATLTGGQTIEILAQDGVNGSTGTETLTLGDVTMVASAKKWSISNVESVVLGNQEEPTTTTLRANNAGIDVNSSISGNGKLVVEGTDVVTLNGECSYTGGTEVNSGTLAIGQTSALTGSVKVASGASLFVKEGLAVSTGGAVSLADGASLRLGGADDQALTLTEGGGINLNDGAILNLSNVKMRTGSHDYILATGSTDSIELGNVDMVFARGVHSTSTPIIQTRDTGSGQELVLTYDLYAPNGLIWDGGSSTWDVNETAHWHAAEGSTGTTKFSTYDDVTFKNPMEGVAPSVATLNDDIWVTHMNLQAGTSPEVKNTVTVNTALYDLNVDFLDAEANAAFVKSGRGTANIGVEDNTFGADLTVQDGILDVIFVGGKNGETQDVSSRVVREGGELVVTVGDGVDASNVVFDANSSLSGLNDIVVQKGSTAEFKGTTTITQPGSEHASIIAGEGATINFTGDTTLSDYEITFGGQGSIILGEHTTVQQKTGAHHYVADSVDLRIEKLTMTSENNDYCIAGYATLTIGNLVMATGNNQNYYHAFEYNEDDTVRQNETIETLTLGGSGVKRLASISTSGSGAELSQQCGSFTVNKVVMEAGKESMTLELANCAITTYAGFDEVESFYLGGNRDSDFAGKIRLWDWNKAGTAAKEKDTVMVLNDDVIAARAVIELDNGADNNNFGVGINADNVKVLGFNDAANKGLRSGNDGYIFSGTVGQETNAEYKSDDTARTLELVGGDTYQTTLGLDKNVDLKMSGGGTQKFVGDNSKFDADITVQDGILEFQNTASLTVQDLTLATASTEQDLNSVVIKNGANVGTAEVHGTVKAAKGAAMASNLTLHADSVLDVHETLSAQKNPEMTDKTDYVGGLNMLGNSLTLHSGAYLSDADRSALLSTQWGERYELAYGLSSLTLGETTYENELLAERGNPNSVEASKYFQNLQEEDYYICFSGVSKAGPGGHVGTVYIMKLPEPTTGTLSLLALAALAARRRRK